MAFNLQVFKGVSIQQVRDTMNYKNYLKTDEEVDGIRVKPEDNTSPILLSIVPSEDERKSDPIQ